LNLRKLQNGGVEVVAERRENGELDFRRLEDGKFLEMDLTDNVEEGDRVRLYIEGGEFYGEIHNRSLSGDTSSMFESLQKRISRLIQSSFFSKRI